MAICDPTADEMRVFLTDAGMGEADEFDIESAIYWFAYHWHGGGSSNLYSALCTSPYSPGPIASGPEPDSMESMLYEALEAEYAGVVDAA